MFLSFLETGLFKAIPLPIELTFLALLAFLSLSSYLLLNRRRNKPYSNLPSHPKVHWLLGNIPVLMRSEFDVAHKEIMEHVDQQGRLGVWLMGSRRCVMLTNAEDVRIVLKVESYRRILPMIRRPVGYLLGEKNILFLNGREWKFHRSTLIKSMTPSALNTARDAMIKVASDVVTSLKTKISASDNGVLSTDVSLIMKMITLDAFGLAALSQDFGCCRSLTPSRLSNLFESSLGDIARRVQSPPYDPRSFYWLPNSRNRTFFSDVKELRSFVMKTIEDRKENKVRHDDMIQNLVDAQSKEEALTPEAASTFVDVMLTALFAGYDTTSITLTYALYLLSQHPDVEAKCVAEIAAFPDWEDRAYCKAVVTETLRIFPPVAFTGRDLERDVTLVDGLVLPRDTKVVMPIWHIHRSEANFKRASDFIPERWVAQASDESSTAKKWKERDPATDTDKEPIEAADPKNFFAFSGGGRSCAGTKFAKMEAAIVLGALLEHFKFEALDGFVIKPKRRPLVQCPENGLPMHISIRQKASL